MPRILYCLFALLLGFSTTHLGETLGGPIKKPKAIKKMEFVSEYGQYSIVLKTNTKQTETIIETRKMGAWMWRKVAKFPSDVPYLPMAGVVSGTGNYFALFYSTHNEIAISIYPFYGGEAKHFSMKDLLTERDVHALNGTYLLAKDFKWNSWINSQEDQLIVSMTLDRFWPREGELFVKMAVIDLDTGYHKKPTYDRVPAVRPLFRLLANPTISPVAPKFLGAAGVCETHQASSQDFQDFNGDEALRLLNQVEGLPGSRALWAIGAKNVVAFDLTVNEWGEVHSVVIKGREIFSEIINFEQTMRAAFEWEFSPLLVDGVATPFRTTLYFEQDINSHYPCPPGERPNTELDSLGIPQPSLESFLGGTPVLDFTPSIEVYDLGCPSLWKLTELD